MLKISDFAPLFLKACPEARPAWEALHREWEGCPTPYFQEVNGFSSHLMMCYQREQIESLRRAFQVVELFLTEGDEAAYNLVVAGLLERLQNLASGKEGGYQVFEPYRGRRSLMAWQELALEREYRWQEAGILEINKPE